MKITLAGVDAVRLDRHLRIVSDETTEHCYHFGGPVSLELGGRDRPESRLAIRDLNRGAVARGCEVGANSPTEAAHAELADTSLQLRGGSRLSRPSWKVCGRPAPPSPLRAGASEGNLVAHVKKLEICKETRQPRA